MNNFPSTSKAKQIDGFEDDEIFDNSSFLANFDNSFRQASKFSESNLNDSANRGALNVSALCCDEEISGYDKLTGKTWIYPTNYPVRDYQFNIIKAAILRNTLVSLPTGLGKTFIAAVIMYNFYRWYPLGKIVFTAPTRPLVAQQIDACYNIIAIPPNDTIEMTGHMQVSTRKQHWQNKRVFFATPQVIYNDMKSGICPCDKVRCLVIDEAHRARGNYAYCQIISHLDDIGHKIYRVVALSATPGSKVDDVINVVKNLHIAHLELRTESCIDVAPYSHARKINTVVIQLGLQLTQLRHQYIEILDGYARRLKQMNILPHNLGNLSKGRIVMLYKEYQTRDRGSRHPQHNYIMKDFTVLIALYHGLELLVQHGSRVFLNFFDEHPEKSWIQSDDRLTALLEMLRDDLGVNPLSLDRSILPDGTIPEMPKDLCFGHPKFDKLKEIITYHFDKAKINKQDTRAIVFCEYRESVNLVHCLLLQCRPLIKPMMFVGQGASGKDGKTVVSQKQQLRVMRSFREGLCNVLVATCVAEEGLDVGSVDLILCFDISTKSPIRLVQRCGRTGRERGGQVFILVTEGREHQTLIDCMRQRDGLNNKVLQSKEVEKNLYKLNPRMIPHDFMPECRKMFITVEKKQDPKDKNKETNDKSKKGQKDLRTMLLGRASSSSSGSSNKDIDNNSVISENEFRELFPEGYSDTTLFANPKEYWTMSKSAIKNLHTSEGSELKLSKWLEWQRRLQKTVNVHHSKDSEILAELLQYSDAKRFEMPPSTQNPCFGSQEVRTQPTIFSSPAKSVRSPVKSIASPAKSVASPAKSFASPAKTKQLNKKKQKVPLIKPSDRKDGDIRALFSTATKSTKSYTKLINDLGIQNDGSIPTRLISLLVDLSLDNTNTTKTCYVCQNICDCALLRSQREEKKAPLVLLASPKEPKLPDINLIDDFDMETILKCMKKPDENKHNVSNNFDLETDFLSLDTELHMVEETKKQDKSVASDNFDIGDIADIFADSSPEEAIEVHQPIKEIKSQIKDEEPEVAKDTLGFFGLDSIDDIFADDEIDNTPPAPTQKKTKDNNNTQTSTISKPNYTQNVKLTKENYNTQSVQINRSPPKQYPLSPSILSGRQVTKSIPTSPILCSQPRKFQLSTKKDRPHSSTPLSSCRKQLIKEPTNNNNVFASPAEKPESLIKYSLIDTTNKSMMTITQLVEMINKTDGNASVLKTSITDKVEPEKDRSVSPILLTQAERKKSSITFNNSMKSIASTSQTQTKRNTSLIILDSDSDSDSTQLYDPPTFNITSAEKTETIKTSPLSGKRKREMDDSNVITASPYFNKKQKLDDQNEKQISLQDKLKAVMTKHKGNIVKTDKTVLSCMVHPNFSSQKENENPQFLKDDLKNYKDDECTKNNNLSMLQMFRRDSKIEIVKSKFNEIFKKTSPIKTGLSQKRKLAFDDSDDDFVCDEKKNHSNHIEHTLNDNKYRSTTNHKVRKKKRKGNEFIDMEAELSDADGHSGDELSDESVGSIVDFICDDDNVTHHEDTDIQALYLKSIKSPVRGGGFKIPELPKKYIKEDIFSQYVEEDAYEMDSFCVDSNIGLTQAHEISELELAEMRLEKERKAKKKFRRIYTQDGSPDVTVKLDSPDVSVKRKNKPKRRLIDSDSDDDSS